MMLPNKIGKLVKKMRYRATNEAYNKALDRFLMAVDEHKKKQSASNKPKIWRVIMRSPIAKIAAAAIVIIACLIGLSLWRTTGPGIALADVLARMEQVKAFRVQWRSEKTTSKNPNKPYALETNTLLISREYGWKTNNEELDPNGGESTFSEFYSSQKTLISIWHKQKKYRRMEFDDGILEEAQGYDPRTWTKRVLGCKYENMGRATIDGIEVEGFRTTDPNWLSSNWKNIKVVVDFKMWVDVKTRLPVRYDSLLSVEVNQMGEKIIDHEHLLMHDFQWDILIDAADFEPVIPDDYTGTVIKYPPNITEETAIQGLKLLVELLGKYPENSTYFDATDALQLAEKSETPAAIRLKEEIKGLTEDEISNKLVDFLMPIRGLDRFYWKLGLDKKESVYCGNTVTPKDADKVLLRWKVSDNQYRVIYGDLHAETVSPEKLAELEKGLSN